MIVKLLFTIIYLKILSLQQFRAFVVPVYPDIIQEVPIGKTAIIHCPSIDQDHNFLFWKINTSHTTIIGPSNPYNREKYDYEILTGELIIWNVESTDEGIFECASKGIRNDDLMIQSVRIIVKRGAEEVYEEEPSINALRVYIAIGIFVILIGGSYLLYQQGINKQDMELYPGEDEDDESNEELFSQPGPSYRQSRSRTPSPTSFHTSIDTRSFKSVLSETNLPSQHGVRKYERNKMM